MILRRNLFAVASTLAVMGVLAAPVAYAVDSTAVRILLQHARYWQDHGRPDLAVKDWQQILASEPEQTQALANLGVSEARQGHMGRAQSYLRVLEGVSPKNPAIAKIKALTAVGPGAGPRLARAAQDAAHKRYGEALSLYRRIFKGVPPPKWAHTYYDTLAQVPGGWHRAVAELRAGVSTRHAASPYALTLGELLTERAPSRLAGIAILASLAKKGGGSGIAAQRAWRQALLWMGQNPAAIPYIRQYLDHYRDNGLQERLARLIVVESRLGAERAAGMALASAYALMNAGHDRAATAAFLRLLHAQAASPKAWEGLADVAMREHRYDRAARNYSRAARTAGNPLAAARYRRLAAKAFYWHWDRRGRRAMDAAHYHLAVDAFRRALVYQPNDAQAIATLLALDVHTGQVRKAAMMRERLADITPGDAKAWLLVLEALSRVGVPHQVLAVERIIPAGVRLQLLSSLRYRSLMAQAQANVGHIHRAVHDLQMALRQATRPVAPSIDIQFGWLLYRAHDIVALHRLLVQLARRPDLTVSERLQVRSLYFEGARREAEAAEKAGHPRIARAIVAHLRRKFPGDAAIVRTQAALLVEQGQFGQATDLLKRHGVGKSLGDYELAIGAALAAHERRQAGIWLTNAQHLYPHSVMLDRFAARRDLQEGHAAAAKRELRAALDALPPGGQANPLGTKTIHEYPFAGSFRASAPESTKLTFSSASTGVSEAHIASTRAALSGSLAAIRRHTTSTVEAGFYGRSRSGTAGLSREQIFASEVEGSVSLGYNTRIAARVAPVTVTAGSLRGPAASLIGTAPIYGQEPGSYEDATGVAFALTLAQPRFGLTVGSSPMGFPVHSLIGAFRWQPLDGGLTLRLFRRDVTDSVLSYAGVTDPKTGLTWGGVFANGLGISYGTLKNHKKVFASLSAAALDGRNVQSNSRVAADVGARWPLVDRRWTHIDLGVDFLSMFYSHNLSNFTYGQGGYFSPQYYFRPAMTTRWVSSPHGRFIYAVNALVGWQVFYENSGAYFPTDSTMQAQSHNAYYPSQTVGNIGYGVRFTGLYGWTRHLYLGAFVRSNNSQNYRDLSAGIFIHYTVAPEPRSGRMAPSRFLGAPWLLGLDRPSGRP